MTLRQLVIFLTVVGEGGFSNAAQKLNISQAAVSAQIKTLEKELGHRLFLRRHGYGKLELTPAGRLTYKAAGTIMRTANGLATQLSSLTSSNGGEQRERRLVQVISDTVAGSYLLPNLFYAFLDRLPGVEIRLTTDTDYNIISTDIRKGNYDLAVVPAALSTPGCVAECTFELELVMVANPGVPAAGMAADFSTLPWVLAPPGTALRKAVDVYFAALGIEPKVVAELDHPEAVRRALKAEPLVAITHRLVVEGDLEAGALVKLEPPFPLPRQEYKVVRPRARFRQPARQFCRFLLEHLEECTPAVESRPGRPEMVRPGASIRLPRQGAV